MMKEADAFLILLIFVAIPVFAGCNQPIEKDIPQEYYDPFEIDESALPRLLPSEEYATSVASEFSELWTEKNFTSMYNMIDPFLHQYKSKSEFNAFMSIRSGKYTAESVSVKRASVLEYYKGTALFTLHSLNNS